MSGLTKQVFEIVSDLLAEHGHRITVSMIDEDLVEAGLLDSMGVVDLVARIEEKFDVVLEAEQLESNGIRSISGICGILGG
jgi:acyl carrier protein